MIPLGILLFIVIAAAVGWLLGRGRRGGPRGE